MGNEEEASAAVPPGVTDGGGGRGRFLLRLAVVGSIVGVVVYLLSAHWVHVQDALPYLFGAGMLVMHLFGHGGHGGHGMPDHPPRHGGRSGEGGAGHAQ